MSTPYDLPDYNTTDFPLAVKRQIESTKSEDEKLNKHQSIVKEFFTRSPNQRGLLICHGMGRGKTRLATSIMFWFREFEPDRRVVILSAKSLEANFRKEMHDYKEVTDEYIDSNFKFISLNSSNMFKQVTRIDKDPNALEFDNALGEFLDDTKSNSLENSLLIVDEAHNLFNSITNGAKNAVSLYDLVMKTTNLRVIFMTGTPIINDPFELVPCFNMLRGPLYLDISGGARSIPRKKDPKFTTLFSEDIGEFEDYFVDFKTKKIKNKDKFTNRIFGLSSYYGDLYVGNQDKVGFPKKLKTQVEHVPMSEKQFTAYSNARLAELEESKRSYRAKESRFSSASGASSTYRVKSRQISNYAIPEYALGPVRGYKSREKYITRITTEDLQNTNEFSPKMGRIIKNIEKHKNQQGIVYSQFVSGEGIGIFSKVLLAHGYQQYGVSSDDADITHSDKITFAVLSGDVDPETRAEIIKIFNEKDTKIQILLLSGALAEGIDLKRVRHVHVMEPFWNYARINQVEARAIRFLSHEDLPEDERNVQVYVYLSDYPNGYPKSKMKEPTTDVDLYNKSIDNMHIINTFIQAIAEASIDCAIHYEELPAELKAVIQCKVCAPDGSALFHPVLKRDMTIPSLCKPYSVSKIKVEEIIVPGIPDKFYYKLNGDNPEIYYFDKKINGYTHLPKTHEYYGSIMEAILKKDSKFAAIEL